jgi:protein-S-isoprenylcysteine O-methyltransferase Ste14
MWIVWILFALGVGLLLIGFAIFRCWMMLWRREGMGFPATLKPQDHLITHGIFGYVRHPHNLMVVLDSFGLSFISLGLHYLGVLFPLPFLSFLFFFAFFPLVVYLFTIKEEEKLIERFGEEYLEYGRRVLMFIPRKQFWGTCLGSHRGGHRGPSDD